MTKEQPEEILGKYLASWVKDLREGKGIEISDEDLSILTEQQVQDLMGTARFIKALEFPTENWQGQSADIRARLGRRLFEDRQRQLAEGYARVVSANDLGACLSSSRNDLNVSIQDIVALTGIPRPLLEDVETGVRPPTRISVDKMADLLRRLHLAFDKTVDLVQFTSENWAIETFRTGQTQLGRVGSELESDQLREAALSGGTQDLDDEVQRELGRIEDYTASLRQQINDGMAKS